MRGFLSFCAAGALSCLSGGDGRSVAGSLGARGGCGPRGGEFTVVGAMLDRVAGSLRDTAVTQLAWLVAQEWPNRHLPALGFAQINQIETYVKYDLDVPQFHQAPDLIIRPVQPRDFAALAEIETIAFEPLWRMSSDTLALAQRDALCFDVAEWNGRVVGYQLCSYGANSAHLVRLTIAPQVQGQGVGSALLAQAIRTAVHDGLRYVSLNTQVDNSTSQHLYKNSAFSLPANGCRYGRKPFNLTFWPSLMGHCVAGHR